MTNGKTWDPSTHGVVAHMSEGGFGYFHHQGCFEAPHRGEPGVRDTIHAPWRYLASHWQPCPRCRPPVDLRGTDTIAA